MKLSPILFLVFCSFSIEASKVTAKERRHKMSANIRLNRALDSINKKNYVTGVVQLYSISNHPSLQNRRAEINYVLGRAFMELRLFHPAAFHFIAVVKNGDIRYVQRSLDRLSRITTYLGDDKLLNFAIRQKNVKKVKGHYRNNLYYLYSLYQMRKGRTDVALSYLKRIPFNSDFYVKARYQMALIYATQGEQRLAINTLNNMLTKNLPEDSNARMAALMGKARVYYQFGRWDEAINYYRQIPKGSRFWHDVIFENGWALLRAGKFRSALNVFHTLHSSYYLDYFQPESVLLRSIIYMYICKYDEMKKVLDLFHSVYSPLSRWVDSILKRSSSRRGLSYYQYVLRSVNRKGSAVGIYSFPIEIADRIYREIDFRSLHNYLTRLDEEGRIIQALPPSWRRSKAGRYSKRLVENRLKESRRSIDIIIENHLKTIQAELKKHFVQEDLLRYEMLRGKRENLKQKISKKYTGDTQIIEDKSRDFFVQNGFEFWPFQGEYWLDELGNYNYVGTQSCN